MLLKAFDKSRKTPLTSNDAFASSILYILFVIDNG